MEGRRAGQAQSPIAGGSLVGLAAHARTLEIDRLQLQLVEVDTEGVKQAACALGIEAVTTLLVVWCGG